MAGSKKTAPAEAEDIRATAVAAQEQADQYQPTPTQAENDKAKLGKLDIDSKEPDGSPAEPVARDTQSTGAAPYQTRDAAKA